MSDALPINLKTRLFCVCVGLLANMAITFHVGLAAVADDPLRTWRSKEGSFSVEAELIERNDDSVRLRRFDGHVVDVPINRLCDSDQAFLKELADAENQPKAPGKPLVANSTPVRIALVVFGPSNPTELLNAMALVESELSESKSFELIERQQIDALLAEQSLMLTDLVDQSTVVKFGGLLKADMFVLLESYSLDSKLSPSVVAFDSRSGARLIDVSLDEVAVETWSDIVSSAVHDAARKRQSTDLNASTICLQDVRNGNLPSSENIICDQVRQLIQRRLTGLSNVSMLERERLEAINQEQKLTGQATNLLASTLLLNIDVEQGPKGKGLLAMVQLTDMGGKKQVQFKAVSNTRDGVDLSQQIMKLLAKKLDAKLPTTQANPLAEARRFMASAERLYLMHNVVEAQTKIEAALALARDDQQVLQSAATILYDRGIQLVDPKFHPAAQLVGPPLRTSTENLASAIEFGGRATDLRFQLYRARISAKQPVLIEYRGLARTHMMSYDIRRNFDCDENAVQFLERMLAVAPDCHTRATQDAFLALQQQCMDLDVGLIHEHARQDVTDAESFKQFTNWTRLLLQSVALFNSTPESYAKQTMEIQRDWLKLLDQYGFYVDPVHSINLMFAAHINRESQLDGILQIGQWIFMPRFREQMSPLYKEMLTHQSNAIRVLGSVGMMWIAVAETQGSVPDKDFDEFYQQALKVIDEAKGDNAKVIQSICYFAICDAIELTENQQIWNRRFNQLADDMIKRKHLVMAIARTACEPLPLGWFHYYPYTYRTLCRIRSRPRSPEDAAKIPEYAKRLMALIEAADTKVIDDSKESAWAAVALSVAVLEGASSDDDKYVKSPFKYACDLLKAGKIAGIRKLGTPVVDGKSLFTVGVGTDQQFPHGFMQVFRVDLESKESFGSPRVSCPMLSPFILPSRYNYHIVIHNKKAFVSTAEQGLFVFRIEDWKVVGRLTEENGLPSNIMLATTLVGDKLFASLGYGQGGFVVAIDTDDLQVETIVSSRRSVPRTPLDNLTESLLIERLVPTDQGRILMVVLNGPNGPGIWELDCKTHQINELPNYEFGTVWKSRSAANQIWVGKNYAPNQFGGYQFERDQPPRWLGVLNDKPTTAEALEMKEDYPVPENLLSFVDPPYLIQGDYIWFEQPFGRVSMKTGKREVFAFFGNRSMHPKLLAMRHELFGWRDFIPLNESSFLICNEDEIWLVKL